MSEIPKAVVEGVDVEEQAFNALARHLSKQIYDIITAQAFSHVTVTAAVAALADNLAVVLFSAGQVDEGRALFDRVFFHTVASYQEDEDDETIEHPVGSA